jgi:hypothetical protein
MVAMHATVDVASPSAAPMMAQSGSVSVSAAPNMMIARPIPPPPNLRPVLVKYVLTANMPTIPSASDVLEVNRPAPDPSALRAFVQGYGLPSALVAGIKQVQSVQASWSDVDGYQWNTDGASGMLNWWKQQDQKIMPMEDNGQSPPAKVDDAKILAAADAFLRAHGLGSVADQGGTVEQYPNQPCIYNEGVKMMAPPSTAPAAPTKAGTVSAIAVKPGIYPMPPYPCRYFPVQANVYYGSTREGKPVVDMGGWPSRLSSVSVDTQTFTVMGGNVVFAEDVQRSSYPLLDQATVLERLKAGGRNPVYPWGSETKDITVTIDKIELAWLRYDSWDGNQPQTYYLPAIAASGHVDRGMTGQEPEEYHTTVALVKDDAFGDVAPEPGPMPVPYMMQGSSGGGSAGSATTPPPMMKY